MAELKTTCPRDCYDRCGLLATVEAGRVTAIRGDPSSPLSHGRLCAKCRLAYNGVWLDASARLRQPLRRAGPKGSGRFVAASWDEALDDIAARLGALAKDGAAHTVLHTHYQGTYSAIACNFPERFFHRYGATEVDPGTICDRAGHVALEALFGTSFEGFDPRTIAEAHCLVLWGVNPSHSGPLTDRHWVRRFAGPTVVVDPLRTRTAEHADLHLQPRPGTDTALALGLLALLAAEDRLDHAFIDRHVRGWPAVAAQLAAVDPGRVARDCGVDLAAMHTAARLIGAGPTLFWLGIGLQRQAQGGQAVRAVSLLPIATGNLGRPGSGILYMNGYQTRGIVQRDLQRIESRPEDPPRISHMDLAPTLEDPRRARALFNWNTNLAASGVAQRRLQRALAREDLFTVAIELFHTDTCDFADWVLPAAGFLEFDDLVLSYFHDSLSAQVRVQAPVGESLPNQEIFRRLAARMGYTEPELFEDDATIIARLLRATGTGLDFASLAARGSVLVGEQPRQQFAGLRFGTPSGAIEIDADAFLSAGLGPAPRPRVQEPPPDALQLLSPAAFWLMNSSYGNDPRIRAQLGESTIALHADDAAARGIVDGALVRVSAEAGELRLRAAISDRVRPGVALSYKSPWPRFERDGINLNALNPGLRADLGDSSAVNSLWVCVTAIAET
jgi:anaerobic selenocysteine-containing dehydrogenase